VLEYPSTINKYSILSAAEVQLTKTTLATCSTLPIKNLGKLMSFHWHPHNKGIYKAALMFCGKLYSSVVPNQPVAADFVLFPL